MCSNDLEIYANAESEHDYQVSNSSFSKLSFYCSKSFSGATFFTVKLRKKFCTVIFKRDWYEETLNVALYQSFLRFSCMGFWLLSMAVFLNKSFVTIGKVLFWAISFFPTQKFVFSARFLDRYTLWKHRAQDTAIYLNGKLWFKDRRRRVK